jgi:hypothetical protein
MKRKLLQLLSLILKILSVMVFLLPVYWGIKHDPWDMLLVIISWLPAVFIFYIGHCIFDYSEE